MSDDTQKPFDFKQAVRDSFRDYPHLRRDTLFFTTEDHAPLSQKPWLHAHGSLWLKMKAQMNPLNGWLRQLIEMSGQNETSYAYSNGDLKFRAMVFNPTDTFCQYALPQEKEMAAAASFYHELGHILCKHGFATNGDDARGESSADAYAALRLLQRYGDDARPAIARDSWRRAIRFLNNSYGSYLTSPVTAQILADSKDGRFNKLTPAETVAAVENYVEKYRATPEQIKEARQAFVNYKPFAPLAERLELIATTCLGKPDGFSFRLGATIVNPFLHSEGADHEGEYSAHHIKLPARLREAFMGLTEAKGIQTELQSLRADMTIDLQRPAPYKPRPYVREC
jgi:hypothetical protein